MPKASLPPLPLQGIFALAKPSGPTSMSLLTRLKPLFSSSRLFMEQEALDAVNQNKQQRMKKSYPGPTLPGEMTGKDRNKGKGKGRPTNWKKVSRMYVKMGSGGTLDPLADGVLTATDQWHPSRWGWIRGRRTLGQFLNCTKTYRHCWPAGLRDRTLMTREGAVARLAPWKHVDEAALLGQLGRFRGDILQTPPIYSALKIDGRPLYEYARQNLTLPRPIEARPVTISKLELTAFTPSSQHRFKFPDRKLDSSQIAEREKVLSLVANDPNSADVLEASLIKPHISGEVDADVIDEGLGGSAVDAQVLEDSAGFPDTVTSAAVEHDSEVPPAFELEMTVSSGTYVRSIVHDLGIAVGSAAHVVVLTRTQQGSFHLDATQAAIDIDPSKGSETAEPSLAETRLPCVDWPVLERALEKWEADEEIETVDEDGWAEWELELLTKWPDQKRLSSSS